MYEYKVKRIIRVVDGDTVDAEITLGFGIDVAFRFRLAGIDTEEIYGAHATEKGHAAKSFVEKWFADHFEHGYQITVRTEKASDATVGIGDGAFGRWLGNFIAWAPGPKEDLRIWHDLKEDLIAQGFAK